MSSSSYFYPSRVVYSNGCGRTRTVYAWVLYIERDRAEIYRVDHMCRARADFLIRYLWVQHSCHGEHVVSRCDVVPFLATRRLARHHVDVVIVCTSHRSSGLLEELPHRRSRSPRRGDPFLSSARDDDEYIPEDPAWKCSGTPPPVQLCLRCVIAQIDDQECCRAHYRLFGSIVSSAFGLFSRRVG